jgi:hypothetical protein
MPPSEDFNSSDASRWRGHEAFRTVYLLRAICNRRAHSRQEAAQGSTRGRRKTGLVRALENIQFA